MPQNVRTRSLLPTSFLQSMRSTSESQRSITFSAISSYISSHLNETVDAINSCIFHLVSIRSISCFNQSVGIIVPTLLVFLQLKYQSNDNQTPFTTHPYTTSISVYSLFVYFAAGIVHLRYPLRCLSVLSRHCMLWSGDVAVASLMSIFLPDWIRPLLYIVFLLMSASEFLQKLFVEENAGGRFQVQRRWARRFLVDLRRFCSLERAEILPI